MKKFSTYIIALILLISFVGCSEEAPSVRVFNEGSIKANVQIKQANQNTININDVMLGQTSPYQTIAEGNSDITAVLQNNDTSPVLNFTATNDINYTIIVTNTVPPALKISTEKK